MPSTSPASLVLCATAASLLLAAAPAHAQAPLEPTRAPEAAPLPRAATSGIEATKPVPTPAEQRQAHTLAGAIFARPAAAAKATAKVDAANTPDLAAVKPKADWADDKNGVGVGGKGVEFKAPF